MIGDDAVREGTPNPHDEVAYPGRSYADSHVDRLATLGTLFGLEPAPPAHCRVAELGCGSGWNLIPMAMAFPDSFFVGIDLAQRPVAAARQLAADFGLSNTAFHVAGITDPPPDLGRFDYVMAHGVYSWVPPDVGDALLELTGRLLTEHGVAYISYLTYPGSYFTRMVRELMLHHARAFPEIEKHIRQSRAMLSLALSAGVADSEYHEVLRRAQERIGKVPDAYLFHDDLTPEHHPCYVADFLKRAGSHGLRFLGETPYRDNWPPVAGKAREILATLEDDPIGHEQYKDLLTGRRFRSSLLCRSEREHLSGPVPRLMGGLRVGAPVRRAEGSPPSRPGLTVYTSFPGSFVESDEREFDALATALASRWPEFRTVDAFCRELPDVPRERIVSTLVTLYRTAFVEFHAVDPGVPLRSDRPRASELMRRQAREFGQVLSTRFDRVDLIDPVMRAVAQCADGTLDREGITAVVRRDPKVAADPESAGPGRLEERVRESVERLYDLGVLEG